QANHPPIAIAADESIPAAQTGIKQTGKLFRENRCENGLVLNPIPTALPTSQQVPSETRPDIVRFRVHPSFSGRHPGRSYTDRPVFWLLIGQAPVRVLHTIRTFLRQRLRR